MTLTLFFAFRILQVTGFIVGKQIWHDLLKHGFESDVSGLQVVLRTETKVHCYSIENGQAVYVGQHCHDENAKFRSMGTRINPNYFSNTTVAYYMDIYSSNEFMDAYRTGNPKAACIGAVLIILGTSLLFIIYDCTVRKEFQDKKQLLQAKRQFVRFVSHEVRTPLNAVCMGLTLIQHDLADVLGDPRDRSGSVTHTTTEALNNNQTRSGQEKVTLDASRIEELMKLSTQVSQNASTAVNVLSDLLNYDKILMNQLNLELSLLPIWHVVERSVNEFKVSARECNVSLKLDFSPLCKFGTDVETTMALGCASDVPENVRDCKVVADSVRLAQVFRNIISNGLKFSKENGGCRS